VYGDLRKITQRFMSPIMTTDAPAAPAVRIGRTRFSQEEQSHGITRKVIGRVDAQLLTCRLSANRNVAGIARTVTEVHFGRSAMSDRIAPKLLAEFIGTFAFVFIGAGASAIVGDAVGSPGITAIALAHGLTIMAFAYAYGHVSGGHMNPAVTVGVLAAGAMRAVEAAGYIVSQLVGGVLAAYLLRLVLNGPASGLGTPALAHNLSLGITSVTITPMAGFVIEAVLAFFLVTVVLSTAVTGRAGNFAPLAIGMTVTLNIIMGGPLTGAAFNPALVLGPMIVTGDLSNAWLYTAAPVAGALIAVIVSRGLVRLAREPATAPVPTLAE